MFSGLTGEVIFALKKLFIVFLNLNFYLGPNPKIERSYMDGSERFIIVNDGVYWPNGLALDFATDRIFWCDAKHHVIENSKLDGSERKKILSNNLPHPFALTIFEDNIFWTDWHSKTISSVNKVMMDFFLMQSE